MRANRRHERGQAYLILVVLCVVSTMIGGTMIVTSTVGIDGEARRDAQDRARHNAVSGLVLADRSLKRQLPGMFKRIVTAANADPRYLGQQMLSTLRLDPVEFRFQIPGAYNVADVDIAEVRSEITLPGPPTVRSMAGVGAGPEVGTVESYCFVAHSTSVGRAKFGAYMTAERVSNVYVTLVRGQVEQTEMDALGSGNVIVVDGRTDPEEVEPMVYDRLEKEGRWDLIPTAYADANSIEIDFAEIRPAGPVVVSQGGAASGGWNGEPQRVEASWRVAGLPNGDRVYYAYFRGIPDLTEAVIDGSSLEGAEGMVLATDSWRFAPSYDPATDTVPLQLADGSIVRRQGTPQWGVLAIRAPVGRLGAIAAKRAQNLSMTFNIPGLGTRTFTVDNQDWWSQHVPANGQSGTPYDIVGWPGMTPGFTRYADEAEDPRTPTFSELALAADSDVDVENATSTVTVPGWSLGSDGLLQIEDIDAGGTLPLLEVMGRRADVTMSYTNSAGVRATAVTTNSAHTLTSLGGIELDDHVMIVDPGGGGGGVSQVQLLAVMYVPLWTNYLPNVPSAPDGK